MLVAIGGSGGAQMLLKRNIELDGTAAEILQKDPTILLLITSFKYITQWIFYATFWQAILIKKTLNKFLGLLWQNEGQSKVGNSLCYVVCCHS